MKIFVAQIKSLAGDIGGNGARIKKAYLEAIENDCNICLLPELVTSGYLAEDLFFNRDFIKSIGELNNELIINSSNCALIIPTVIFNDDRELLHNVAIVAQNGKIIGTTYKSTLPNHGVFDDKRYFTEGVAKVITINDTKVGIPICEDIWHFDVCNNLKSQGAEIFLVPNASPFELGKFDLRKQQVIQRYKENIIPLVFCNQASCQDGIVFDGNSFCYDGKLSIICDDFSEDSNIIVFNSTDKNSLLLQIGKSKNLVDALSNMEQWGCDPIIYKAIVFALKSYIIDNNFTKVIFGLSGGVDSALVAALCSDAIGAENVTGYMMPSKLTSDQSFEDANELIKLLGINSAQIPINSILDSYITELNLQSSLECQDLTYQNLQARIRGSILMAESNKTGSLLITTGNKSELASGYATLYGDMNGGFNPIKDVYKTQVFALAKYRNTISYVIPQNIITKPPTAELASNQKDSDSLPEYDLLDEVLYSYIELNLTKKELYEKFSTNLVDNVVKLVLNSEFKRKQSAPGVKISIKNFEKDRRFPITNRFNN